jgi:hypothetical protein
MKNKPNKISYSNKRRNRNMWLFDAGLHTQHLKMNNGEMDVEFVNRFLIQYFNGCKNRGGKKYKDFFMWLGDNNYISVWGIK